MRVKHTSHALLIVVCLGTVAAMGQAPVGPQITYQGELKDNGVAVNDVANFVFDLWDAEVGGRLLASASVPGVAVVDGRFTAHPNFGSSPFDGRALWLEITVEAPVGAHPVTLAGRQPITPAPYALFALNSDAEESPWSVAGDDVYYNDGYVGVGTTPSYPLQVEGQSTYTLHVRNTSTNSNATAIYASSAAPYAAAIQAEVTDTSSVGVQGSLGQNHGVLGHERAGVYGWSQDEYGVWGDSANHWGVAGTCPAGSNEAGVVGAIRYSNNTVAWVPDSGVSGSCEGGKGVPGRTKTGIGVYGIQDTSGNMGQLATTSAGVYGQAESVGSSAVRAHAVDADAYAGYFTGGGVYVEENLGVGALPGSTERFRASTSSFIAVSGTSSHTSGNGVRGTATASSGPAYGVYGISASPDGASIFGQASGPGCVAVMGTSSYGAGTGGWFTSDDGDAVYAQANKLNTSALQVEANNGAAGLTIDQDTAPFAGTAAINIDVTGTQDPVALRVNVDADYGSLADLHLTGAGYSIIDAFRVESDNDGHTAYFRNTNVTGTESALLGFHSGDGDGVRGIATDGNAVSGRSLHGSAAHFEITDAGNSHDALIATTSGSGAAIHAYKSASGGAAIECENVWGTSNSNGTGLIATGGYRGVHGEVTVASNTYGYAVYGNAEGNVGYKRGVYGRATGDGSNYGVYGYASGGTTTYAGYFNGNVNVTGTLSKGGGSFKIDHPLDPANKYLMHSFVESPDMMNIYNGNVVLDGHGTAVVTMPAWFEALNREFRYQLTCIGGYAPVYVAEEIEGNQFSIAGGTPGLKVSWQVTGVRQDAFAEAHRIPVEVDKPADERGTYLHPEALGEPAELQTDRVREKRAAEARIQAEQAEMDAVQQ
jgi:hypothetical protein